MHKQKYQAYAAATQTVAKTKQIVLLYDGAIRTMQQAKEAIREKRVQDRYNLLIKTSEIVVGLQGCLDFDQGGDIAKLLYNFYASLDSRIFSIHRTNDLAMCDEIIADLKQMRNVWHSIDEAASGTVAAPVNEATVNEVINSSAGEDPNLTLSA